VHCKNLIIARPGLPLQKRLNFRRASFYHEMYWGKKKKKEPQYGIHSSAHYFYYNTDTLDSQWNMDNGFLATNSVIIYFWAAFFHA